ncbi:MAG: YihY/virulence factor BrkB family protein [Eubacterium sp.]|nr:YihY/virulence factor BrkB family protein [Eubacterium sp.]
MKLIQEIKAFSVECKKDHISAYAAQSAYFTLLSLIPFLLFFCAMLKYTPVSLDFLISRVELMLPDYVAVFLVNVIRETYRSSTGLMSISALVAILSAARAIQFLTEGLNRMYDLSETRNWLIMRFWACIYTCAMMFALLLMLMLLVFGRMLQQWFARYFPTITAIVDVFLQMRILIGIGTLTCIFTLLYCALPNRKANRQKRITWKSQLPGAFLCAIAWYVFSGGVSVYVNYFHGFSSYGSLTTIALIMFWLYVCMYILMVCAEINHLYSERIHLQNRRRR